MTDTFILWAIDTFIATSLLIALVMVIRKPVARLLGPQFAYALWLLPAVRSFLPALPKASTDTPASALTQTLPPAWESIGVIPLAQAPTPNAIAVEPALYATIAILWFAGFCAFLAWQIGLYHRSIVKIRTNAQTLSKGSYGTALEILVSPAIDGPVSFGLFKPMIALPLDFQQRYTAQEQGLAIRHELAHINRQDLWVNMWALFIRALHWPNPLVHLAFRHFRVDQEMACDHNVLRSSQSGERSIYGRTLMKTVQATPSLGLCPLNSHHQIKERLIMLKSHFNSPNRTLIGSLLVGGLALTSLGLSATYVAADEKKVEKKAEKKVITKVIEINTSEDGEHKVVFVGDGNEPHTIIGEHKILFIGEGDELHTDVDVTSDGMVLKGNEVQIHGAKDCQTSELKVYEDVSSKDGEKTVKERLIFCSKNGEGADLNEADILRKAITSMKEEEASAKERRQRMIAKLEERLNEIEKAEKKNKR